MRQWARGGQKRKGRAEIGEIRERKGGKYKKVGSRKWIRLPKGQKPDGEKRPEPGTVEREIKKGEKQPLTAGQKRLIATQEKRLGKLKDQRKYVGYGNKGLEENIKDETAKLEKLKSKFEAAPVVSRKPDEPPPVKSFAEKVRQEREFSEALKGHPKAKKISGKYAIRLPAWAKKQLPEDLQKSSYSISALNRHEKWKILSVLDRGPAAKSKMGKLSATHQKVLEEAERSGSIRTGTGKGTIRQLSALAERGLLESKAGGGYSLTEAGAEALESGKYDRGAKAEPYKRAPRSAREWVRAGPKEGRAWKKGKDVSVKAPLLPAPWAGKVPKKSIQPIAPETVKQLQDLTKDLPEDKWGNKTVDSLSEPPKSQVLKLSEQAMADLYKVAPKAQVEYRNQLNQTAEKLGGRFIAIEDYLKEGRAGDIKKDLAKQLDEPGPVVILGPLKEAKGPESRAYQKAMHEYGGDWSKMRDVVRGSIAVDTIDDLKSVVGDLEGLGFEVANEGKDRFTKPPQSGYRDFAIHVKTPSGMVAELQVHAKPLMKAKEIEGGHKYYEEQRSFPVKYGDDDEQWPPEAKRRWNELNEVQNSVYGEAWKSFVPKKKAA